MANDNLSPGAIFKDIIVLSFQILIFYLEALIRIFLPKSPKSLEGEVVVVTGGGRGIGKEISKQVSRLKVKSIAIWDLDGKTAEQTAKEIFEETGVVTIPIQCDVSDRIDVSRAAKVTRESLGPVTILFNNAGIMPCKPFLKHSVSDLETVFKVNVFSQFFTLFEFLPDFLAAKRGHIVSLSSTAGVTGTPNLTAYCSTKHAIKGLMDSLFLEIKENHSDADIKMTTIHPFVVNTGLAQKPISRFNWLIPFTEPEEAARVIIDGMRRDEYSVFVPRHLLGLFAVSSIFPLKVKLSVYKFLGCGVGEHDN